MRILCLAATALLLPGAHRAAAQEDYTPDGKLGVKFGPWAVRPENGCSVARNIVDADNWRYFSFWVEPFVVEVMASGGKMFGGTLTVEGGLSEKFVCYEAGERYTLDRTELNPGLIYGSIAVLELDLAHGKKAGPFRLRTWLRYSSCAAIKVLHRPSRRRPSGKT